MKTSQQTSLGQRIRARRSEKGLTLPQLADEAGVAKGYLSQIENDLAQRPSAKTLFSIAIALGTTIADLMGSDLPNRASKIPRELSEFARDANLTEDEIVMLAGIHYRGRRPTSADDWKFIYESIKFRLRKRTSTALLNARRKRSWQSRHAAKLVELTGLNDPIAAIKLLASNLLKEAEVEHPPVDLPLLASCRGVSKIEPIAMKEAGRLIPSPAGLTIQVNEADPRRRRNFTIAHEIAHTILPTFAEQPRARTDDRIATYDRNDEEEYLCDVAASALIFPEGWLSREAQLVGVSAEAVCTLAERFDASLEATALAWSQLGLSRSAVVFWEEALKPSEMARANQFTLPGIGEGLSPVPLFRVGLCCATADAGLFLPKHKSAPSESVIDRAAKDGSASGVLRLELKSQSLTFDCDAKYVPYVRNGDEIRRVMTLLRPSSQEACPWNP